MSVKREKVIYKDLSYRIVGILFEVYNELGYGYQEKYYQRAIENSLKGNNIKFESQAAFKIRYKGKGIGRYFLDFLIEDKIVLEIKKGKHFSKNNLEQIKGYLKVTNKKLAILANFTPDGVKFYRMLNIN